MKVKLELEYRGDSFSGWQRQPGVRTVQEELEKALGIYLASLAKRDALSLDPHLPITASGRTDAGVHARRQVASFSWPEGLAFDAPRLQASLNGITPPDLVVRAATEVPDYFDARHSPHLKLYTYRFLPRPGPAGLFEGRVWQLDQRQLDIPAMIAAARHFVGKHDYSAFRAQDCTALTTERTIVGSELARADDELLLYCIIGKGFLKQMVRIIAGTLYDVGRGKISADAVPGIIASCDRRQAGQTAPAHGLTLEWVRYL